MDEFHYHKGALTCERIPVATLADRFGTPLYCYSTKTFLDHYRRLRDAFSQLEPLICFSVKSCHNLAILRMLAEQGAGFDVVSGGELARVREVGVDGSRVVFAGVGKADAEITAALEAGMAWFNAESEAELDQLASMAHSRGVTARVALRVNPDVDPKTHVYTTTGKRETKFGVDLERAARVYAKFHGRPGLDLTGLHMHLGSPVNTIEPYVAAIKRMLELVDVLDRDGIGVTTLNLGGGFGAHYDGSEAPQALAYAEQIVPLLEGRGLRIILEPGRCIAANAGVLLTRVLYTKSSGDKEFVIVDGSMTELIRPALYGSFHFVWPVTPVDGRIPPRRSADLSMLNAIPGTAGWKHVDIVGPVCESGDFLAKDRCIPPVGRGDLLAVFSAGAYAAVMGSQYNSRPRAAEVLVDGDGARLIRRRETYDDLVACERL